MDCTIISIGTELSLGLVLDTNSQYIADALYSLGIEVKYIHTLRDNKEEISNTVRFSLSQTDLIVISGGLGPTDDDITRVAVAEALGTKLIRDKSLDETSLKFIKKIKTEVIKNRLLRQSYVLKGSYSFKPRVGSASGFGKEYNGKWVFCIPGVPREMKDMFNKDVIPKIKEIRKNNNKKISIKKHILMTTDISETEIETRIRDLLIEAEKTNIKIGITANPGLIKVILISMSDNDKNLGKIEKEIKNRLGDNVYGKNNPEIGYHLKKIIKLANKKITISTAESITGGLIGNMITAVPGSSEYFLGGLISYSNDAKIKLLDIDKKIIKNHGAVSKQTCLEMAKGSKEKFSSGFALSATGYAGPEGEDVGLVYCCVLCPDNSYEIFEKKFVGIRGDIKFRTSQFILNRLMIAIRRGFGL